MRKQTVIIVLSCIALLIICACTCWLFFIVRDIGTKGFGPTGGDVFPVSFNVSEED